MPLQNNLIEIDLSRNRLTGTLPEELFELSVLKTLNLGWNKLTGPLPLSFTRMRRLRQLTLVMNDWEDADEGQAMLSMVMPQCTTYVRWGRGPPLAGGSTMAGSVAPGASVLLGATLLGTDRVGPDGSGSVGARTI